MRRRNRVSAQAVPFGKKSSISVRALALFMEIDIMEVVVKGNSKRTT